MKKIFILMIMLQTAGLFAQDTTNKKHNVLWDFGVHHTYFDFKSDYSPPRNHYMYPNSVTLFPGTTHEPVFSFQSNLTYRFYMKYGFNISAGINIINKNTLDTQDPDSIIKYYLYPDSIKNTMPFYRVNAPTLTRKTQWGLGLDFAIGYRYKRFLITWGIFIPVYENNENYNEYKSGDTFTMKSKEFLEIDRYSLYYTLRLEALILNKKIPTSLYFEVSDKPFVGFTVNLSKIHFN